LVNEFLVNLWVYTSDFREIPVQAFIKSSSCGILESRRLNGVLGVGLSEKQLKDFLESA